MIKEVKDIPKCLKNGTGWANNPTIKGDIAKMIMGIFSIVDGFIRLFSFGKCYGCYTYKWTWWCLRNIDKDIGK